MKATFSLFLGVCVCLFCCLASYPQIPVTRERGIGPQPTFSQTILDEFLRRSEIPIIDSESLKNPEKPVEHDLTPEVTLITFDDVIVPWNVSGVAIAPNRYPGVSFYAPYAGTYTLVVRSSTYFSYPNELSVGAVGSFGELVYLSPLHMDFSARMQNVSFWIYQNGCRSALVDIYDSGNFLRRISVTWPAFADWIRVDLASQSSRITSLRVSSIAQWDRIPRTLIRS